MAYDARTRQRYRHAVSAVTGVAALGVVSACGWVAGLAARDHQDGLDQKLAAEKIQAAEAQHAWRTWVTERRAWERARAAEIAAHPTVRTVWKKRARRTVIDTRVVHVAPVGTGGEITSGSSGSRSTGHTTSGSESHSVQHAATHTSTHTQTHTTTHSSSSGSSSSGSSSSSTPAPPPAMPPPAPSHGS